MAKATRQVAYVIVTARYRDAICSNTLAQLKDAGIKPHVQVVLDIPVGFRNLVLNQRLALEWARDRGYRYVLFLEDDIDVDPRLGQAIEKACEANFYLASFFAPGRHFYSSELRRAVIEKREYEEGFHQAANVREWTGAQALLISTMALGDILDGWPLDMPLHTRVGEICAKICPLFIHVPNLIQHYGAFLKSTWGHGTQPWHIKSVTYNGPLRLDRTFEENMNGFLR